MWNFIKSAFTWRSSRRYCIKRFYICNLYPPNVQDLYIGNKFCSNHHIEVYKFTAEIIKKYNLNNLLDLGCGMGDKLEKIIFPVCKDVTGIDKKYCIDTCIQKYAWGNWLADDIEFPKLELTRKYDLIIASDIIEHLFNPDNLFSYIRKLSNRGAYVIISTPERDLLRGRHSFGFPPLAAHVREWNMVEFNRYVRSHDFSIVKHFIVEGEEGSGGNDCQVVFCKIAE